MKQLRIAVAGDKGSFSDEVGLTYAKKNKIRAEFIFAINMEGVLKAINSNKADLGIFPVVNSRGGLVESAIAAMGKYTFEFIDELPVEIKQCLLALPGTKKKKISIIATHSQAFTQCAEYIKKNFPKAELIEWEDTAKAAKDLANGEFDANTAVIAPARSAEIYGLNILEKGIQDANPNITTFITVKKLSIKPSLDKAANYRAKGATL